MNMISYIAYALFTVALLAWAGVVYAGLAVQSAASERSQNAAQAEQQADRVAYASRLRSLAGETADERARLEQLTNADVVSAAKLIESVGKSVSAKVNDALPEGSAVDLPGGGRAQALAFIVTAQGSFPSLMRALEMYEHLSLPSRVTQVEFEKSTAADPKNAQWRMNLRIKVVTSALVSS